MAKYEITHCCGHTETVQLYGSTKERERRIRQMESHPCADCRAKEAQESGASNGFAELTGSPKQIAWASDIRDKMIVKLDSKIAKMDEQFNASLASGKAEELAAQCDRTAEQIIADTRKHIDKYRNARKMVATQTSSKWFIDNSEKGADSLAKMEA